MKILLFVLTIFVKLYFLYLVNGGLNGLSNGPIHGNFVQSATSKLECNEENVHNSQSKISQLTKQIEESEEKLKSMDIDLRARDTVISELETRITLSHTSNSFTSTNNSHSNTTETKSPLSIEVEMMRQQLNTLQSTIAKRDEQIEQLNLQIYEPKPSDSSDHEIQNEYTNTKPAFDALQREQDDLLIMLSEQDNKLELYKNKLRELGHNIVSDDEEGLDDTDLL